MNGSEIRGLRRSLKLTQEQFANKLGIAKSTIARWEIDLTKPSPLALTRIKELQDEVK